jgi:hypothetical protein
MSGVGRPQSSSASRFTASFFILCQPGERSRRSPHRRGSVCRLEAGGGGGGFGGLGGGGGFGGLDGNMEQPIPGYERPLAT